MRLNVDWYAIDRVYINMIDYTLICNLTCVLNVIYYIAFYFLLAFVMNRYYFLLNDQPLLNSPENATKCPKNQ